MDFNLSKFTVCKKFALTISRGTTSQTTNILIKIQQEQIEAIGEATPFSLSKENCQNTEQLIAEFDRILPIIANFHPLQRQEILTVLEKERISSPVKAAIDMALYDWLGKKTGLPLWRLWGLNRDRIVPISVTIGIDTPEKVKIRVQNWLELVAPTILKVKLGSPAGIEADRAIILAVKAVAPDCDLTVDANGGWNLKEAIAMSRWLADLNVKYLEQPLAVGKEAALAELSQQSPLPIFVDESCLTSKDIPRLAKSIAGVNLKIMKAGGLTEIMRSIQVAKACGLKVMFGCYSDSSLANTAMAHLSPLADYLDLDSHLNLTNDPFTGAILSKGHLLPNDLPGLGVRYSA
ncbi:MAG: dipeptide epimerase [Prochloraceae cyanobacterium]|nr:dipeptide epimerase [Prochloraceae cyanobacterium]